MPNVIIIKDVGVQGPPGPPGPSGSGTNTFPYTGSAIISGSLTVNGSTISTQGFTGSLLGTASYALFAENGGGGGNGGFTFATTDDQLDIFAKTYLDGLTPTRIITGSINEPLTYIGEFQLFEIINVSRQLGLTLSTYGNVNMTSSININEDTDLTPGTYFSAPSGSYFSSITFGTTVGNQSIKVYERASPPPLLEDGLFTTSSVIISKNLYVYEDLEVFGGITGSLYGTSSFAATASYALNANSQGSGFPFSGSAVITGSIEAGNTPFPFINNQVNYNQTSSLSIASISLEPKSNLVDSNEIDPQFTLNEWSPSPSTIFVGTIFRLYLTYLETNYDYLIGTRVFTTGSSDIFGIQDYKYVGDVISWGIQDGGSEDDQYYINIKSVIVTSSLPTLPPSPFSNPLYKFYSPSGSGIINLKGYVTASEGLLVTGPTNLQGTTKITGSLNITGSTNIQGIVSASNYIGSGFGLSGIITNPMYESLIVYDNITATGSLNSNGLNQLNIGTTNFNSKTINLGQLNLENGYNDANYINLNRNVGPNNGLLTHTQFNFNGNYWKYEFENDIALLDTNNHLLSFITNVSSSGFPTIVYNRFIDLQFHTKPTGSNIAKGFSTNYNGSTYFNVTGSISASAYYGDGSNLTNLYTTPVLFSAQTSSYTASLSDLGKMVELSGSSNIEILIPSNSDIAFPTGSQITFIATGTQTTTFVTGSGVTILSTASRRNLFGQYSVATCVKKSTNTWYLFGDIN